MTNDIILIALGLGCALWSIGLVLWVVVANDRQRRAVREALTLALTSMFRRTGEVRQTTPVSGKSESIF